MHNYVQPPAKACWIVAYKIKRWLDHFSCKSYLFWLKATAQAPWIQANDNGQYLCTRGLIQAQRSLILVPPQKRVRRWTRYCTYTCVLELGGIGTVVRTPVGQLQKDAALVKVKWFEEAVEAFRKHFGELFNLSGAVGLTPADKDRKWSLI